MRYTFEINGKTYFADVINNSCAPSEVIVYDETKKVGTGMKWIFESLGECVEKIVAKSQR